MEVITASNVLIGLLLAFASAASFGGNNAFASRPLVKGSPLPTNFITLIVGLPITIAAVFILGQESSFLSASVLVIGTFALVGILHFGVARMLVYTGVKNMGANESGPLVATQVLYSLVFAVVLFRESVNLGIGIGVAFIVIGVAVMSRGSGQIKRVGNRKIGYSATLLGAAIFGFTPILIKTGLQTFNYPIPANTMAYAAACASYVFLVTPRRFTSNIRGMPKASLFLITIAGVFGVFSQLFRFAALSLAPVVIVVPIIASQPIYTLFFTRIIARDIEVFSARIILSIFLVILGSVLVSVAGS